MNYYVISDDAYFCLGIQAYYQQYQKKVFMLGSDMNYIAFAKQFFKREDLLFIAVDSQDIFGRVQKALVGSDITVIPVLNGVRVASADKHKCYIEKNAPVNFFLLAGSNAFEKIRRKAITQEGMEMVFERAGGDAPKNISIDYQVSQNYIYRQMHKIHKGFNIKTRGCHSVLLCYRLLLLDELSNNHADSLARQDYTSSLHQQITFI